MASSDSPGEEAGVIKEEEGPGKGAMVFGSPEALDGPASIAPFFRRFASRGFVGFRGFESERARDFLGLTSASSAEIDAGVIGRLPFPFGGKCLNSLPAKRAYQ